MLKTSIKRDICCHKNMASKMSLKQADANYILYVTFWDNIRVLGDKNGNIHIIICFMNTSRFKNTVQYGKKRLYYLLFLNHHHPKWFHCADESIVGAVFSFFSTLSRVQLGCLECFCLMCHFENILDIIWDVCVVNSATLYCTLQSCPYGDPKILHSGFSA